jgi:transposase-like protein
MYLHLLNQHSHFCHKFIWDLNTSCSRACQDGQAEQSARLNEHREPKIMACHRENVTGPRRQEMANLQQY